jgi:SHS2 domain-containing protein
LSTTRAGHRFVDHTGDMALEVWAPALPELFDEAVRALFAVIVDVATVEERDEVPVAIAGAADRDDLLVRFLSELLFLHDARGWLFRAFRVRRIDEHGIEGEAHGEPMDPERHAIERQVKAVTYHALGVREDPSGWRATIVLDL